MTHVPAKPFSPLSNCTVDTSYRFTFYQVSYSVIFLLGLATNGLALRRLCRFPYTVNSTAIYMVSLSAADLFFVISLPLRIYYYNQKPSSWTPGVAYCHLTFTLKYISLYGGIFFLVCIAVDRYFAVVHPLASTLRRLRVAQLVSGVIWFLVLGLSVGLPLLRSAAARQHQPCLLDPSLQRHRTIILAALGLVLGLFLLPTVLLLYSYCRVLSVLRQPRHRSRSQHRSQHYYNHYCFSDYTINQDFFYSHTVFSNLYCVHCFVRGTAGNSVCVKYVTCILGLTGFVCGHFSRLQSCVSGVV
uniref:G-protein coupled receptors family 1 profile domain-containing protein n=1 Tax=Seriola dumerili TaxID=41447 RepID=A0A3B4UEH7_SERDU